MLKAQTAIGLGLFPKQAICINRDEHKKAWRHMMDGLDNALGKMDFQFFGSGKHGIGMDGLLKNIGNDNTLILDVRTEEELKYVAFPFAVHIPLNDLPDKIEDLPKDKLIITFCSSIFRGAMAYTYLLANGFEKVKGLTVSTEDMVKAFKPGPLSKM